MADANTTPDHDPDERPVWDGPHLPPPWSAVQDDETGLWEVVCDGYDDEMPVVCAGTASWPMSEADANILSASLDLLDCADLALEFVRASRAELMSSGSLIDPDTSEPMPGTLDADTADFIEARIDPLIRMFEAALAKAAPPKVAA